MIIERNNLLQLSQIQKQLGDILDPKEIASINDFLDYYQLCRSAVNEVGTRLENLDSDYQLRYQHNPISRIDERVKNIASLMRKMRHKGLPEQFSVIDGHIYDIGGVRVIVNYIEDVYQVAHTLLSQDDLTLLKRRDYIKQPKENGYRSLHLILSVPVFQTDGLQTAPVEVQIRTLGMDMWASLEQKLHEEGPDRCEQTCQYSHDLKQYADRLNKIEGQMQTIFGELSETEE